MTQTGKRLRTLLLLVGVTLAGCADENRGPQTCEDGPFGCDGPGATDTTGRIRCVVVDDAIVPLADVTIKVYRDGEVVQETATGLDGACLFAELEPGTHRMEASKPGYETAVVLDAVEAGEGEAWTGQPESPEDVVEGEEVEDEKRDDEKST